MSTSSSLVIFNKVSNGGCDELVHHLDTVVGAHPSCLESQRLDFFFSTNITFSLLRSFFAAIVFRLIIGPKIHNIIIIVSVTNCISNNFVLNGRKVVSTIL